MISKEFREVEPELLKQAENAYDDGKFLCAYQTVRHLFPPSDWKGSHPRNFGGRLAFHLGAPRLARVIHDSTFRLYPDDLEAYNYRISNILNNSGPHACWRVIRRETPPVSDKPEQRAHLLSVMGYISAFFRDFAKARNFLTQIETDSPDSFYSGFLRATISECADDYDALYETGVSLYAEYPRHPNVVELYSHILEITHREEEALASLRKAVEEIESGHLRLRLALLEIDLGYFADARATAAGIPGTIPLAEKELLKAHNALLAYACYLTSDIEAAKSAAMSVCDEYHKGFCERLSNAKGNARKLLDVGFVRQSHLTCAPATISALTRYWGSEVAQPEIAEAICYDGTPLYKVREWGARNGYVVRDFTVNAQIAKTLIDRSIPFGITITQPEYGHFQALIGYDTVREVFLIRDPFRYFIVEQKIDEFLEYYRGTGPRGTVIIPPDRIGMLEGIELPDCDLYDSYDGILAALEVHDTAEADRIAAMLASAAPSHYLACLASIDIANYNGNISSVLDAVERFLSLFPECTMQIFTKIRCLLDLGRTCEAEELLRQVCSKKNALPYFYREYARLLQRDGRKLDDSLFWLRKAAKQLVRDAECLVLEANALWSRMAYEDAKELYRFALCAADKREAYAHPYFAASRYLKRTDESIALLSERVRRYGARSSFPAISLANAYRDIDDLRSAEDVISGQLSRTPEDGDLLVFAAEFHGSTGRFDLAESFLERAEHIVRRGSWLRAASLVSRYKADKAKAIRFLEELAGIDPLSVDTHRDLAYLYAETEGARRTIAYFKDIRSRFPAHYGLNRLAILWLKDTEHDEYLSACKALSDRYPSDIWLLRELAIAYSISGDKNEAEKHARLAVEIDPLDGFSHSLLGDMLRATDSVDEARGEYRKSLELVIDNRHAISRLFYLSATGEEKENTLRFVEDELIRQTVFGDGLLEFYECARLVSSPEEILESLRFAHAQRPDLWCTYSLLVRHLLAAGDFAEADKIATKAIAAFPLLPKLWLDLADVKRALGDAAGEEHSLLEAHKINPSWSEAAIRLANFYHRKGDLDSAVSVMERACIASPLETENYRCLALYLYWSGKKNEAFDRMEKAVRLDPVISAAWESLCAWACELDKRERIFAFAITIVTERPKNPDARLLVADACFINGNDANGYKAIDEALRIDPRYVIAYDVKARHLADTKKYEEALSFISLAPFDKLPAKLAMRKASVLMKSGQNLAALHILEDVNEEVPGEYQAWESRLDCLWNSGSYREIEKVALDMIRFFPSNTVPFGYLGGAYKELGELEKSRGAFERAYELVPSNMYAAINLFDIEIDAGNTDHAEDLLHAMIRELGEDESVIVFRRLLLLAKRGKVDEALVDFGKLCVFRSVEEDIFEKCADAIIERGDEKPVLRRIVYETMQYPDFRHNALLLVRCKARLGGFFMLRPLKRNFMAFRFMAGKAFIAGFLPLLWRMYAAKSRLRIIYYKFILFRMRRKFKSVFNDDIHARSMLVESLLVAGNNKAAVRYGRAWNDMKNAPDRLFVCYIIALYMLGKPIEARLEAGRIEAAAESAKRAYPFMKTFSAMFRTLDLLACGEIPEADVSIPELGPESFDNLGKFLYDFVLFVRDLSVSGAIYSAKEYREFVSGYCKSHSFRVRKTAMRLIR